MNRSNPQHFFWVVWVCKLLGTFLAHAVDYTRPKIVIRVGLAQWLFQLFFFFGTIIGSHTFPTAMPYFLLGEKKKKTVSVDRIRNRVRMTSWFRICVSLSFVRSRVRMTS